MSNADFYEIRTVLIRNSNDLIRIVSNSRVVDYHLCKNVVNGFFKVILVLEV